MAKGIIGKKIGMSQIFHEDGRVIPVTVVQAGPCTVVQVKTLQRDRYAALQLGFDEVDKKKKNKPEAGRFEKAGVPSFRHLQELRVEDPAGFTVGQVLTAEEFKVGDFVDVIGVSKGKGFMGVMKRWGFRGGAGSHGSMFHRAPGSIGASSYPSRVWPGQKMGGHQGDHRTTTQNLEVVDIRPRQNLLLIKGAVPGGARGLLFIQTAKKKKSKAAA
jgi:large subunit ribosomal protein L3